MAEVERQIICLQEQSYMTGTAAVPQHRMRSRALPGTVRAFGWYRAARNSHMGNRHVVKAGDCLISIAAAHGFADPRGIYDAPENAALRKTRPNPNVLVPGDVIVVPDKIPATFTVQTGQAHRFVVKRPKARLLLRLECNQAMNYELTVDRAVHAGTVEPGAVIDHAVPAGAGEGLLRVFPETFATADEAGEQVAAIELRIGGLDPVETITGAQARLAALGYFHGKVGESLGDATTGAVAWFQQDRSLAVTGELDDDTQHALTDAYGC
jgi:hypothetical protein